MAQLTLYHAAPSRSSIVRWMLEEIGEPYDIHLLRLMDGDQLGPDYLAINPMGKVPALKHGDVVITEAAAVCTYLADAFPRAGLSVPIGDRGAASISNGCSSVPDASSRRSPTAPFRVRGSRAAARSAMAISTP